MTKDIPAKESSHELERIFADITDYPEMIALFEEIFTAKELNDLALRWQLLKDLYTGRTQRSIALQYHISLCKITRGSKILKKKGSTIKKILDSSYGKAALSDRNK